MPTGVYLRTKESRKLSDKEKLNRKINTCKRYNKPTDDTERFWSYVDIKGLFDCWEWQGGLVGIGYGHFTFNGKDTRSHRLAYELYYNKIPNGLQINHKCNNPKCCNPFHLYAGTQKDNIIDAIRANRQIKGESQGSAKLTEKQVIEIRMNKDNLTQKKLAEIYEVTQSAIHLIVKRKNWKHI